MFHMISA